MPQFVILRHESPQGVHFDFMLEWRGVLKTWSLCQPPEPGVELQCEALADHRLAYLDYEGPISHGRGSVTRWDRGVYTIQRQSDTQWVVDAAGDKTNGTATLRNLKGDPSRWTLEFRAHQTNSMDTIPAPSSPS
jgi:hypothetical protein